MSRRRGRPRARRMDLRHRSISGRGSAAKRGKKIRISPMSSSLLSPTHPPTARCRPTSSSELNFRAQGSSSEKPSWVILGLEQCFSNCGMQLIRLKNREINAVGDQQF